jgi:KaiC/GvpD/RAD55 family RecA-like ATPase
MTDPSKNALPKTLAGIEGLHKITHGGLPQGRTVPACGSSCSGRTVLGLEFLVHGILDFDKPGVLMAFEETEKDLTQNAASFGYDLERMQYVADCVILLDHRVTEQISTRRIRIAKYHGSIHGLDEYPSEIAGKASGVAVEAVCRRTHAPDPWLRSPI